MKEKRRKILPAAFLLAGLTVLWSMIGGVPQAGLSPAFAGAAAGPQDSRIEIVFFYNNACESCREEEDYYEIAAKGLEGLTQAYSVSVYNTFRSADRVTFQDMLDTLQIPEEEVSLPVMIIGSSVISGKEEMAAGIRELAEQERSGGTESAAGPSRDKMENGNEGADAAKPAEEKSDSEEDSGRPSGIVLFTTYSCDSCARAKALLGREGITFAEVNIAENGSVETIYQYFSDYQVPERDQKVPVIFYANGYFSGADAIEENIAVLKRAAENHEAARGEEGAGSAGNTAGEERTECSGSMGGEERTERSGSMAGAGKAGQEDSAALRLATIGKVAAAGLLNGLNPCAASMLLMVLSVCLSSGRNVLKTGLVYLAARFLAYFLMGTGLYKLLSVFQGGFLTRMTGMLKILFFLAAVVLAVLNFMDFLNTAGKKYGKVRVQLPVGLRRFNHSMIRKLSGREGRLMYPAVFGLGLLISAGEFFCTGQIYVASVAYIFETNRDLWLAAACFLLLYIAAMCVPHLLLVFLLHRGSSITGSTQFLVKHTWLVKLLNSILFVLFAIWFLVQ